MTLVKLLLSRRRKKRILISYCLNKLLIINKILPNLRQVAFLLDNGLIVAELVANKERDL